MKRAFRSGAQCWGKEGTGPLQPDTPTPGISLALWPAASLAYLQQAAPHGMKCKWLVACVWVFPLCCGFHTLHVLFTSPMVTPLIKMLVLASTLADIGGKKKLGPDWVLFKKEEIREKGGAESFSHRICSFRNSAVPSWRSDSKRHKTRRALYTVPFTSISFCLDCSSWHQEDSHHKRGSSSWFGCNLWIIASESRFKTKTINQLSLL